MEFSSLTETRLLETRRRGLRFAVSIALHVLVIAVAGLWQYTEAPAPQPVTRASTLLAPPPRPLRRLHLPKSLVPPRVSPAPLLAVNTILNNPLPQQPPSLPLPKPRLLEIAPMDMPAVTTPVPVIQQPKLALPPAPEDVRAAQPAKAVKTGQFDAAVAADTRSVRTVQASGFDAGSTAVVDRKRQVQATGFDVGSTAIADRKRQVQAGGFETARAELAPRVVRAAVSTEAVFAPVEILEKPRPVYTEEARRLRVEGAVQLRVVFTASGEIRVVGVVRGLGHGLDEAAAAAAARIRFRPARRDGQPVDSPAMVQIVFQLA